MKNEQPLGLTNELKTTLGDLRVLADEIRLQLHLAGMDAKDLWNRDLEPRLFTLEKRVERDISAGTKTALSDLRDAMTKFRSSLQKPH